MKPKVSKCVIEIIPESDVDDAYIEEVLGLLEGEALAKTVHAKMQGWYGVYGKSRDTDAEEEEKS